MIDNDEFMDWLGKHLRKTSSITAFNKFLENIDDPKGARVMLILKAFCELEKKNKKKRSFITHLLGVIYVLSGHPQDTYLKYIS